MEHVEIKATEETEFTLEELKIIYTAIVDVKMTLSDPIYPKLLKIVEKIKNRADKHNPVQKQ